MDAGLNRVTKRTNIYGNDSTMQVTHKYKGSTRPRIKQITEKLFKTTKFIPTKTYPNEVSKEYFDKIYRSKKFSKTEFLFHVSEKEKLKSGIKSISFVQVVQVKFDNPTYSRTNMQYLIKIKFSDKSKPNKYAEISEGLLPFDSKFDDYEVKLKDVVSAPLETDFWDDNWKDEASHKRTYDLLEDLLIKDIPTRIDPSKSTAVLEICGGKGDFAKKLLREFQDKNVDSSHYWLVEYSSTSCDEARENLNEFNQAAVVEADILTIDFSALTEEQRPNVIIASGALTAQVMSDIEESKLVLKKLITIMPENGLIYLTGLQRQLVSLAEIEKFYPFQIHKKMESNQEFLILQKDKGLEHPFKIQNNGSLDLFYFFQANPHITLKEIFADKDKDELAKIKTLDLSLCPLKAKDMEALSLLPNLTSLHLANVENVETLLSHLPAQTKENLKDLDVSLTNITEEVLMREFGNCHLANLRLDRCENLSVEKQIELMLILGQRRETLDLNFMSRRIYQPYQRQIINALQDMIRVRTAGSDEDIRRYKKIKIPITHILSKGVNGKPKSHIKPLKSIESPEQIEIQKLIFILASLDSSNVSIIKDEILWNSADDRKLQNRLEVFNSNGYAQGLYSQEQKKIDEFLIENKEELIQRAQERNMPIVIKKEQSGLPRTLEIHPNGHVYILLKTKNIAIIGKGKIKKVKHAYDMTEKRLVASYTVPLRTNINLMENLQLLQEAQEKGMKGVVQILSFSIMPSFKRGFDKVHVLTEYFENKDLSNVLMEKPMPFPVKKKLMLDVFEGILALHEHGFAHLDLHTGNIFIKPQFGSHFMSASIGDLDMVQKIHSKNKVDHEQMINIGIAPPEILKQCIFDEAGSQNLVIDEKIDVWMMGLLLAETFGIEIPFVEKNKNLRSNDVQFLLSIHLRNIGEFPFIEPEDKNSLGYLIWEMLKTNPKERISMMEAKKRFEIIQSTQELKPKPPMTSHYITVNQMNQQEDESRKRKIYEK